MKRLLAILGLLLLVGCTGPSRPVSAESQVSSVDTNLPVNQHIVRKDESLWKIAQRYHVKMEELLRLNPKIAEKLHVEIKPNQELKVPQKVVNAPIRPNQSVTIPQNEQLTGYEEQVLALTNQVRKEAGLPPCAGNDSNLNRSARAKSEDMANRSYFSHTSPVYGDPFAMMRNFGVTYQAAGENIAKGQPTPQDVVDAWMASPGHRANILNKSFTHLGVGYVAKNGQAYWTQQFIGK